MKTNLRCVLVVGLVIFFISFLPLISKAQIGFSSGDPDAPLDGGVSILIAAGIGYGVKKVRDNKMKNNSISNED